MDMEEIIDNVFVHATEFMHQSGIRVDEDHVGKQQDLYLWCSVGGGSLGLPNAVHDRLSLRNPHYRDTELSHASGFWRP